MTLVVVRQATAEARDRCCLDLAYPGQVYTTETSSVPAVLTAVYGRPA